RGRPGRRPPAALRRAGRGGRAGDALHGGDGPLAPCAAGLRQRGPLGGAQRRAAGGGPMTRWLPYPLLALSLLAMWLLLNRPSVGHVLLGGVIALAASWAMRPLHPAKPRLRRWSLVPRLVAIVAADIARSNVAVT